MPALGIALPREERAQRTVGQAVGDEVQIIEHDQRPELERGVDGAADGATDHRAGAELPQRPDVRAVVDAAGKPLMCLGRDARREGPARRRRSHG